MESKLLKLKTDFNNIINVRTTVKNIFDILQIRINKLKKLYEEFIKNNKTQMFVFGLDSFNFQSKLIDIEYDDMKRIFLAINNRMYCEYFKLYKIIIEYITVTVIDKKIIEMVKTNNYPIYKDLEPYKEYKFEIILDIHENILNLLSILISTLNNKENELLLHKNKQSIGLNIDNFITTFNYSIIVMREKIIMFITYIEFFHKLHTKYLKRFANKIQLMYNHINNDIHFDETSIEENNDKKNIDDIDDIDDIINEPKSPLIKNNKENIPIKIENTNVIDNFEPFILENLVNDNISIKSNTDSLSSNNSIGTPRFKNKNSKTIYNLLSLNNKNEPTKIEECLSHDELNDMFSTIDSSCDSIINNKKVNILSAENNILIPSYYDNYNLYETHKTEYNETFENISIKSDLNNFECKSEILELNNFEHKSEILELNNSEHKSEILDLNNSEHKSEVSDSNSSNQSLISTDENGQKKKRAYNKKKFVNF
jgi:hypothetical protein